MMTTSFALGDHYEAFIRAQMESGRYESPSDVVKDALRRLEAEETSRPGVIEDIRRSIEASRSEGVYLSEDEVSGILEARLDAWESREAGR